MVSVETFIYALFCTGCAGVRQFPYARVSLLCVCVGKYVHMFVPLHEHAMHAPRKLKDHKAMVIITPLQTLRLLASMGKRAHSSTNSWLETQYMMTGVLETSIND